MIGRVLGTGVVCVAMSIAIGAQTKTVPRPPAPPPGPPPAGESAAPDGYQPLPQWLGQTRAPAPAKTEAFTVETFAAGTNGAAFQFLPDGRILLGERNGRIRIVGKDGKLSEPLAGMPPDIAKTGQTLFSVERDQSFATNHTIYFTYAVRTCWRRSGDAALAGARPRRQRADLGRREAPRRCEGPARRRRDGRARDSSRRWHAAGRDRGDRREWASRRRSGCSRSSSIA